MLSASAGIPMLAIGSNIDSQSEREERAARRRALNDPRVPREPHSTAMVVTGSVFTALGALAVTGGTGVFIADVAATAIVALPALGVGAYQEVSAAWRLPGGRRATPRAGSRSLSPRASWSPSPSFQAFSGQLQVDYSPERLRLKHRTDLYTNGAGDIYLDRATVTVRDGAEEKQFEQAALITDPGFPLRAVEQATVDFELSIPAPFADGDSFDAHCFARGREVDVTYRVYATVDDSGLEAAPPFSEFTVSAPFALGGEPPAGAFLSASGNDRTGALREAIGVASAAAGPGNTAYVFAPVFSSSQELPGNYQFQLYGLAGGALGNPFAESNQLGPPDLRMFPRIAADQSALYVGRRQGNALTLEGRSHAQPHVGQWQVSLALDPSQLLDTSSARPVGVFVRAAGPSLVVQSDVGLVDPNSELLVPPYPEKAYGSFVADFSSAGAFLELRSLDRDLLALAPHASGGELSVSAELPPRNAETGLRIELRDALGAPVYQHDEPVLAFSAQLAALPDGGALVLVEDRSFGRRLLLLRLDAAGSSVYRLNISGEAGSFAVRPDGSTWLTYRGTLAGLTIAGPVSAGARNVPLLAEISDSGHVLRADQIACGGVATLVQSGDGAAAIVGSFEEHFRFRAGPASRERLYAAALE